MRKIIVICLLAAHTAAAATEWVHLKTPDFEMYTTAGEKRGREAILYFEMVRSFFGAVSPSKKAPDFPVRIIAFKSEKQFQPFAPPGGFAAAYYTSSRTRDYIVMRDLDASSFPVAIHEYMHLVVRHSGLKLPLWLNEGWADVYSTLKPIGGKTMVGDLLPGRVQTLQTEKWLEFDALTSVSHDSPSYNEKNRAGIFYAESWALTHMLYFSPEYFQNFNKFLAEVGSGKSAAEACRTALGRPPEQVFKDLKNYLGRNRLFGSVFDVKLEKSAAEAVLAPATDLEASLVTADLFAAINRPEQAREAYQMLLRQNPGNAEISRSLGYLAWQNNDRDAARSHFRQAFEAGENDPQMCYHLALLERDRDGKLEEITLPLIRALLGKPEYNDARMELGFAHMRAQNYEGAIAAFTQLRKLDPDKAAPVFNALAYAWLKRGSPEDARKQAALALKWATNDSQKRQANEITSYLDRVAEAAKQRAAGVAAGTLTASAATPELSNIPAVPSSPNEEPLGRPFGDGNPFVGKDETVTRVEGMAQALDCNEKGAILRIQTAEALVSLNMPEPDRVLLKHKGADTFEFTCGPQKPFKVTAEFVPGEDKAKGTVGTLRLLEF